MSRFIFIFSTLSMGWHQLAFRALCPSSRVGPGGPRPVRACGLAGGLLGAVGFGGLTQIDIQGEPAGRSNGLVLHVDDRLPELGAARVASPGCRPARRRHHGRCRPIDGGRRHRGR